MTEMPESGHDFERLAEEISGQVRQRVVVARWFGDKDRDMRSVTMEDLAIESVGQGQAGWAVALVTFSDGDEARYGIPFVVRNGLAISDSADDPLFSTWWIESAGGRRIETWKGGALEFRPFPWAGDSLGKASKQDGSVLQVEQSNTSIRYGDVALAKVFRRLSQGMNPEIEITVRLAAQPNPIRIASPLAEVVYRGQRGEESVGFFQRWVPNVGDGWSWTRSALNDLLMDPSGSRANAMANRSDVIAAYLLLGQRTGELHRGLAEAGEDTAFSPLLLTEEMVGAQIQQSVAGLEQTMILLTAFAERTGVLRDEIAAVQRGAEHLRERLNGMNALVGTFAIRVHGDYHLGQVLRTTDGDWTILDFEGEPARPIEERRRKYPAMKDVGGMLRSFAYARGAALRTSAHRGIALPEDTLQPWETEAKSSFVEGYRSAVDGCAMPIVPAGDTQFGSAMDAWELDKALYEVRYELANRPEWLYLPLAALKV